MIAEEEGLSLQEYLEKGIVLVVKTHAESWDSTRDRTSLNIKKSTVTCLKQECRRKNFPA